MEEDCDNSGGARIGRPHDMSLWRKISMQWPIFSGKSAMEVGWG